MTQTFTTQLPSGGRHFGSTALYNPAVPFIHTLGTVEAGKMFYISGITSQNPKRITINFDSGQDVAFHFDIRFCVGNDQLVIVRNTKRSNSWEREERALNGPFPFQADTFFDIIILVHPSGFKNQLSTASGGQHFGSAPVYNPNQLPTASGGQHLGSTPIYNPTVPFLYKNLKGVIPGKLFYMSGIPFKNAKRITIALKSRRDQVFHFDIRLCYCHDRNVIVRNTWLSNGWGQEERTLNGPFPFKQDEPFDIMILIESARFKVSVNSQPLFEFMHRVHFHRIDTLRITGDVRLFEVKI